MLRRENDGPTVAQPHEMSGLCSHRSTALIIQNRDGSLLEELPLKPHERYYAEVAADDIEQQTSLIERIIALAFDVLGARHVELRVHSGHEER